MSAAASSTQTDDSIVYECVNIKYMKEKTDLTEYKVLTNINKIKALIASEFKFTSVVSSALTNKNEKAIIEVERQMQLEPGTINKLAAITEQQNHNLSSVSLVMGEQNSFINSKARIKLKEGCQHLYYVAMYHYFPEHPSKTKLIISMFIAVFPELKIQQHFFITKSPYYMLYEILNKGKVTPLKYLSIKLHSFASSLFESKEWCTAPIQSMDTVLNKYKIKTTEPGPDHPLLLYINKFKEDFTKGCFIQSLLTKCVPITSDFEKIWNPDNVETNELLPGIFQAICVFS